MAKLGTQIEKPVVLGLRRTWRFAGAPVDGTSGTLVGVIDPGDLLIDTTNTKLYINSGTQASPVYSQILSADVAFEGDVTITGDVTLTDEDVAVAQGDYIYLDGQSGGEYIIADAADTLMINATTTMHLAIGGTDEVTLTATALSPGASDGNALGTASLMWADLFLASGGVINFNNGDVTITHSANVLAFAGGTSYTFDVAILPSATNGAALGSATVMWSDLFLASGGVINFDNGNMTITHSAADLAIAGGTLTTAGIIVGTVATGISFTGTYTGNVIDFTSATIAPTGSGGPCFIRAGAYGSPIDLGVDEDQSGMIRMYVTTQAGGTSYDRGLFMFCETTGTKGIMPVAGLAEVGAGGAPTSVYPCQFIAHLNSATATLGANARMFGGWFKITANEGATIPSTAIAAPLWVDNQLYGSNISSSMEEYGIWATTGGTQPKAFIGFETTSSGYDCLFYWDETAYDHEPLVAADITGGTKGYYIRCNVNGTLYGLQLYAI